MASGVFMKVHNTQKQETKKRKKEKIEKRIQQVEHMLAKEP